MIMICNDNGHNNNIDNKGCHDKNGGSNDNDTNHNNNNDDNSDDLE